MQKRCTAQRCNTHIVEPLDATLFWLDIDVDKNSQ